MAWIILDWYQYYYLYLFLPSPYPYSHIIDEDQVIYDELTGIVNDIKNHIFDKETQFGFECLKQGNLNPTHSLVIAGILKTHHKNIQSTLFQKDFKERTPLPELTYK